MDPKVIGAMRMVVSVTSLLLGQEAASDVAALFVKKYNLPAETFEGVQDELNAVHRKARGRAAEVAADGK